MKKSEIIALVVVVIAVAVIASLVTAGITGNVVGVKAGTNYRVYTSSEVDKKFSKVDSKLGSLSDQLNNLQSDFDILNTGCSVGVSIKEGEKQEVYAGGRAYTIDLLFLSSSEAKFEVMGEVTNILPLGGSYKFSSGEILYLKNITYQDYAGGTKFAYIGFDNCAVENIIILNLFNRCMIYSVAVPNESRQVTGDEICLERNAGVCVLMVNYDRLSSQDMIQRCTPYVTGRSDTTAAYCCQP